MSDMSVRKTPSREQCQKMIKRILITEVLEKGKNTSFRQAADFMNYFQSLYPPSDALTKQVQRAIKAMGMPKDENGYFIVNKTSQQKKQEDELKHLFDTGNAGLFDLSQSQPLLLKIDSSMRSFVKDLLSSSITFENRIDTIVESSNGLIIYTKDVENTVLTLESLLPSRTLYN